jgi:hypothetical protein
MDTRVKGVMGDPPLFEDLSSSNRARSRIKCGVRPCLKLVVHIKHTMPCFNKGCCEYIFFKRRKKGAYPISDARGNDSQFIFVHGLTN